MRRSVQLLRKMVRAGAVRAGAQRGTALVEFALVLPLLLVLVMGIIDFGRAYQTQIMLTNAVREGARLGATGASTSAITSRVDATDGVTGATISVTNAQGTTGQSVTVQVRYNFTMITPLGSLLRLLGTSTVPNGFTLSATADMRLE